MIQEKSSSESKFSLSLENKKLDIKNDVKKVTASEAMVNTLGSCVTLHGFYFALLSFSFCKFIFVLLQN